MTGSERGRYRIRPPTRLDARRRPTETGFRQTIAPIATAGGRRQCPSPKQQHLDPDHGPKRILSLDGGGIRGILTLEYLAVIEAMLRQRFKDPNLAALRLFRPHRRHVDGLDHRGGTCVRHVGRRVEGALLGASARASFEPGLVTKLLPEALQGTLAPKFPSGPLQQELDKQLGADTTLDSDTIRTGLMIMTKRLDTGSPWPLNNGGRGKYAAQDGALRLTQIVRASTAAPTYFAPEEIEIHSRDGTVVDGAFVDGGVTPVQRSGAATPDAGGAARPRLLLADGQGPAADPSRSARASTGSPARRRRSSATRRRCRALPRCNRSWTIASG